MSTERGIFEYLRAEQHKPLSERKTSIYEYIELAKPTYPTWDKDWDLTVEEVPDDVYFFKKSKDLEKREKTETKKNS